MIDHLSSSQINLYLQCGLKYKYQYIDLIPKSFTVSALAFGGVFHSTLDWFHKRMIQGKSTTLENLYQIFDVDWYTLRMDANIRYKPDETEDQLITMGRELLSRYFQEKHKQIKGCEVPFTVPLYAPDNGHELGIALEGYFDLIETDGTIVEFKTSAVSLNMSDIDTRLQLTAYSYAYQILNRNPPKQIRVVNFVKAKKPKIISIETSRDRNDSVGFLYTAQEVLHGIQSKVFPPRLGFWCKECEYASLCPLWKHKVAATQKEPVYAEANVQ